MNQTTNVIFFLRITILQNYLENPLNQINLNDCDEHYITVCYILVCACIVVSIIREKVDQNHD
jgi:hypothetical protein